MTVSILPFTSAKKIAIGRQYDDKLVWIWNALGNGYPIWTLSFCKSVCGNEDLLGEILEEAAGNTQNYLINEVHPQKKINTIFYI